MPETIFQAYLDADKIYLDLTNMPTTMRQKFVVYTQNQSLQAL